MLIKDLLKRDLSRKIEEIIQVDQADEQSVYDEITDYVVTDRMRDSYATLLKAIAEGPAAPDERVGVWISGFFGSGKSSFAKNLGYVLANPTVLAQPAAELFKAQVQDAQIAALVDSINARIPTEVVMFDIQKDRAQTGQGNLSISPFMYRVLLRKLDYAQDFDIAELEISLEAEGLLPDFIARFNARYAADDERNVWERRGRSGSQVWNRAGAILHELDPRTYPSSDSFARGLAQNRVEVSPQFLVQRSFELMERRRPSKALAFIIDEVGAYVAFSQDRLEDLRAVVEEFGKQSKNRVKARTIVGPTWVIVTAQERLDEVTSAMGDDKKVLLAKVQDRFQYRVDLSPADIREVATRRVLSKTEPSERQLDQLFTGHQGQLITATRIERTTRRTDFGAVEFTQFYPYLPHYIELSIDIVSGIRLQPGATRHIGGSNRTIISQVYQMLVNERTRFADRQVGALVTLDCIYELIEAQVGSAKQKDISDIDERPKDDPTVRAWAGRVARVIALLEYVRDLPRTPANIAALLVDEVGRPAPVPAVEQALAWLVKADFVRETDQGFKLQTAQEKNWTTERKGFLEPRPKERNEIKREMLGSIFAEAAFKTYNYRGLKNFRVGITVDGARVGDEGQVPLALVVADDETDLPLKRDQTVTEIRQKSQEHQISWVFPLTPEIDDLVANVYASRQMIARYNALQAQNKINSEEATSLSGERAEEERLKRRLRDKLSEALVNGIGVFRGRTKDSSELGRAPAEIFKRLFDLYVPDLYPKLELGARSLKGSEAEEVLKAANLNALPQVFYGNDNGLGLVVQEGQKFVLNSSAPIAKEVLDYLRAEHSYGNRVTGRGLEEHFRGIGYGWDLDVLQLVLAVLLRAGAIEVTHQGRRFRNHQDPQCRVPLVNNVAFRAAGFAPRESIDLKTLINAVKSYEQLTGDEVDVEEGAIAAAFKKLAGDETNALLPVIAEARANQLPVQPILDDFRTTLLGIQSAASDDCVRILAGEGVSFKETRDRVRAIRAAVSDSNLARLRQARNVLRELWPELRERGADPDLAAEAAELEALIGAETFFEQLAAIETTSGAIQAEHCRLYLSRHRERYRAFAQAIEDIRSRVEWALVPEETRDLTLQPLSARMCVDDEADAATDLLPGDATRCVHCGATLGQIESDLAAVTALKARVIARIQELTAPEQPIARIRIAEFFSAPLDTPEAVDAAVEALRAEHHKLVAEGALVVLE
jgi:hypothetical protein